MPTLATAKAKWERKMATAGPKWKKGVTGKGPAYGRGMAEFLGVGAIRSDRIAAWQAGVDAVSAEEFSRAVQGKGEKWARRLREAMTG